MVIGQKRMQLTNEIALRPYSGEDEPARSHVLISGQLAASSVSGCVLEAAVQCTVGWLLFASHDVPYEESVSNSLLNVSGELLDSADLGGMYTTGTFSDLQLEPPNKMHFQFFDDAGWYVELFDQPKLCVPWLPDGPGSVWRSKQLRRWFALRRRGS